MRRRVRLRTWKQPPTKFAMNVYRARPVKKKQTLKSSCWAACLESWTRSSTKLANLTEKGLLKYYGQPKTGGLGVSDLAKLRTWLTTTRSIKSDLVAGPYLESAWMEEKLEKSYILIGFQTVDKDGKGTDIWHTLLVYGQDNFVYYLEPRTGELEYTAFDNIQSPRGFYRFWTE
jgi:hypothetical protein